MDVATFRFGIISEFVTGTQLIHGEKERLLKEKAQRSYKIPHSKKTSIARSSIMAWVKLYQDGQSIESLMPKARKDKGNFRTLDKNLAMEIRNARRANPSLTVPMLIKILKRDKVINVNENIRLTSIYRFLKNEKLSKENSKTKDRRKFEAEFPNEVWQSDVMHGPKVKVGSAHKKAYLHGIIDDHSRFIVHAQFCVDEKLSTFKDCFRKAIEKRGLPIKLYVDNGACYSAVNLEQITACLGIGITHTPPYTPQGRGKIERWFKTVRECFLPLQTSVVKLEVLNEKLDEWVDEYNENIHSSIKMSPAKKYKKNLECVRSAPDRLIDYFRLIEFRMMAPDRTFRINNKYYEGPSALIGRRVELRFHKEKPDEIEVFFNNESYGMSVLVDVHVNSRIGREYKDASGELFESGEKR